MCKASEILEVPGENDLSEELDVSLMKIPLGISGEAIRWLLRALPLTLLSPARFRTRAC